MLRLRKPAVRKSYCLPIQMASSNVMNMQDKKWEFVIVGSGAGGATLARELSNKGRKVLVVEKGRYEKEAGTTWGQFHNFELDRITAIFAKWKEQVIIYTANGAGGTTVISHGNGIRCLEEELTTCGITLEGEFAEAEREMRISPIAERLLSDGSKRILWASRELGYKMEPMPKFIDPSKCGKCGLCAGVCVNGAKWTALDYLREATQSGAEIIYNTAVEQVIVENGAAKGVKGIGPHGRIEIQSEVVILATGGLGTPVILQRSGIKEAGSGLFVDLVVDTYGVTKGLNQLHEPATALVDLEFHKSKGFILSPSVSRRRVTNFTKFGVKGLTLPAHRLIGIMTKIADETVGHVYADGTVSKPVTERDWAKLREGSSIAKEILIKAGADSHSIVFSKPQGGHPGGTAAIGRVVDKDLQTEVNNLFVCDASVFPAAPGLPPILTIVALAKRLAKTLAA